jgi:FtsZ-interacting cell division protein ZipA
MVAIGLLLLAAAGVTALAGFWSNSGGGHIIPEGFDLFGYNVTGSPGRIFLYGVIVGVVGMIGLSLLLRGLRRGVKHKVETRRERKTYRHRTETLEEERDRLARELEEERAAHVRDIEDERAARSREIEEERATKDRDIEDERSTKDRQIEEERAAHARDIKDERAAHARVVR